MNGATGDGRGSRPRIVLATSNGTGMGHLARQAAVGLALREVADPVVFSLSTAVSVMASHGLRAEYCPSHHRGWMPHPLWHRYLRDRLSALVEETEARVVVFDGVAPYLGLLRARAAHPDVAFCWMRRGMWRPGANERALSAAAFFDLVVEPGDVASDADRGATAAREDATRVGPVTLLEGVPQLSRAEAAAALGLDPARPTCLVTLGAGSINDTRTPSAAAVRALVETPDWQVAVTRAPLAAAGLGHDQAARVHELAGVYPLVRYLAAFDAAVSAAGYNAVQELLHAAVPTVLVPNAQTATDDQRRRARWAADVGLALYAEEDDPETVGAEARRLLDPTVRASLRGVCATLPHPRGASEAAGLVSSLAARFDGHRPSSGERWRARDLAVRDVAMRRLGTSGTAVVRRALGRGPLSGPSRRLTVEPLLTDRLDDEVVRGDRPVEHLMPGTSPRYRRRRWAIAQVCYDLPRATADREGADQRV